MSARIAASLMVLVGLVLSAPAQAEMGDPPIHAMVMFEELEYGFNGETNPLSWDSASWIGGDWNRVWLKFEGEMGTTDLTFEGEAQLLYSRLIAPFWEFQVGLRGDLTAEDAGVDGRGFLAIGFDGVAPHWFEIEPTIFISHEGDVSARLRVGYDVFITQKLMIHTSFETNLAIQEVPEFGVGVGINDIQLGLRLAYHLAREFAPYIGVSWTHFLADTGRLKKQAGEPINDVQGVAGVRFWF